MTPFKIIESDPSSSEKLVGSEEELLAILHDAMRAENQIYILDSMGSGSLTMGIGAQYGFAEFMQENAETPYLITCNQDLPADDQRYVEFDSGGTPTPIPLQYCLPVSTIIHIAQYFFKHKTLPQNVHWVEE